MCKLIYLSVFQKMPKIIFQEDNVDNV